MNPQQTTGLVSTSDSDSRGGGAEDDIPWNRENGSSKQDLQGMKKSFRVRVDPHSTPGSGRGTETPMGRTGGRRRGYWLGRRGTDGELDLREKIGSANSRAVGFVRGHGAAADAAVVEPVDSMPSPVSSPLQPVILDIAGGCHRYR